VNGTWRILSGSDVWDATLEQRYQAVDGSIRLGALNAGLRETRLVGDRISFVFVDNAGVRREFTGRVNGAAMDGTVRADNGQETRWTATRR
jgi:hypothetical protein